MIEIAHVPNELSIDSSHVVHEHVAQYCSGYSELDVIQTDSSGTTGATVDGTQVNVAQIRQKKVMIP